MSLHDDEKIEAAARRLRQKLGIDDQVRPDMKTVIIKLKECGLIDNYVRVPDSDMPDEEAFFDSVEKLLYVRESTFCAADAMYTFSPTERRRARFTLAHEVGHIALEHAGIRHRGEINKLKKSSSRVFQEERDAERFAAAFLVPAYLVE